MFPLKARRYTKYCTSKHQHPLSEADVFHAHTLFTDGVPAHRLSRVYRKPFMVAIRSTDVNLFYRKLPCWRPYAWNTLMAATHVITLSDGYRTRLLGQLPPGIARNVAGKITVIPNGIAEEFFDNRPEKDPGRSVRKRDEPINLLYIGTFIRRKNLQTLVKAAAQLHARGLLGEFRIIGGSHGDNSTIPGISGSLPGYVRILNRMTAHELIPQYRWADVFAMPSWNETFGLVYAEALSQGTPVVCTKGEGFGDWVREDVTGVAVGKPENVAEVANAIVRIAAKGDPVACVADAARFQWSKIAEKYKELYTTMRCVSQPWTTGKIQCG
jgi:glycosyltransferase involved in cell wall biosynthesis